MKKKNWLIVAAIVMIATGILRASGGIALFLKGSQLDTGIPIIASEIQMQLLAAGLVIIGVLFVLAAGYLIRTYSRRSWILCWIVSLIFIAGGLLNGFLLYGQPLDQGQKINLIVFILIGVLLLLGKPALRSPAGKRRFS